MIRVWLFLHLLGFTAWIGGALASMVAGFAGRREDRARLGAAAAARARALPTWDDTTARFVELLAGVSR